MATSTPYFDVDAPIKAKGSAASEFGSNGIKADVIAEDTAAAGVTVDGLLIKDGDVELGDIADPGNAGAIPITRGGVCHIVTAGAETRTVADPTRSGLRMSLYFLTDGGNAVVTFTSPVNQAANNTLTLADAGDSCDLVSHRDGASAYAWRVVNSDLNTGTLSTV